MPSRVRSGSTAGDIDRLPEIGLDHLRMVLHVARCALGDLATEVQHGDGGGEVHHDPHVVLDEENGQREALAYAKQHVGEGTPRDVQHDPEVIKAYLGETVNVAGG